MKRLLLVCGMLAGCLLIFGALIATGVTVPGLQHRYAVLVSSGIGALQISVLLPVAVNAAALSLGVILTTICLAKLTPTSRTGSPASSPADEAGKQRYDY